MAGFQREALEALGEKSVELMLDPHYYKSHAEYETVSQRLNNRHDQAIRAMRESFNLHKDQLEREYLQQSEYTNQLCDVCMENYDV